jgi:hypothetical protein
MARAVDFVTGTVVTAAFLNDTQEVESALAWGVRIDKVSATQYSIPAVDAGDDAVAGQSSIIIQGKRRYWTSAIVQSLAGSGDGTYGIYLTAGAGPAPTVTHTTGAAPANSRKIGEVLFAANAITAIRNMVDAVPGHGYNHRPGTSPGGGGTGAGPDPLLTAAPAAVTPGLSAAEGTSAALARADHVHNLDTSGTELTARAGDATREVTIGGVGPSSLAALRFLTEVAWYRSGAGVVRSPQAVTIDGLLTASNGVTLADAKNIAVGTGTGTKIGTSASQKLGFFNATPVVQRSAYTNNSSRSANRTLQASFTLNGLADVVLALISDLQALGLAA